MIFLFLLFVSTFTLRAYRMGKQNGYGCKVNHVIEGIGPEGIILFYWKI